MVLGVPVLKCIVCKSNSVPIFGIVTIFMPFFQINLPEIRYKSMMEIENEVNTCIIIYSNDC